MVGTLDEPGPLDLVDATVKLDSGKVILRASDGRCLSQLAPDAAHGERGA